jgi:hypothetical protein
MVGVSKRGVGENSRTHPDRSPRPNQPPVQWVQNHLPRGKAATHPNLASRLAMSASLCLTLLPTCVSCYGKTYAFNFHIQSKKINIGKRKFNIVYSETCLLGNHNGPKYFSRYGKVPFNTGTKILNPQNSRSSVL